VTADAEPFGTFLPPARFARLLDFAQRMPPNALGKQMARIARGIYLWRAPTPSDVTVGELRLRCYLGDNTCERKFVFTPWRFDTRELAAIDAIVPRDGVFVDIGANVGIYTLHVATRMGAAGRVVAFEPYLPAYRRLCFNIEATRASRAEWPLIDAVCTGIADVAGVRQLVIDSGNLGGNSIAGGTARFSRGGAAVSTAIECRPLLETLTAMGITRIDALKIDIEGAEDVALLPFLAAAGAQLLPRRIVHENSDALWSVDLRGALATRGYRLLLRTRLNSVYELADLTGRARRP
jgi:FkbM family methyltransferase